jgi:hypothetical protein
LQQTKAKQHKSKLKFLNKKHKITHQDFPSIATSEPHPETSCELGSLTINTIKHDSHKLQQTKAKQHKSKLKCLNKNHKITHQDFPSIATSEPHPETSCEAA